MPEFLTDVATRDAARDQLQAPAKRLIRREEVLHKIGVAHSTLDAMIKSGEFPEPIQLGRRLTVWLESEVDEWIDALVAQKSKRRTPR